MNTLAYDDMMKHGWGVTVDKNAYAFYLREQADDIAKFCWAMMQYWFRWHAYWVNVASMYNDEE